MNKEVVKQNIEGYFNCFKVLPCTEIISDPRFGESSNIISTSNPFFFFNSSFNLRSDITKEDINALLNLYKTKKHSCSIWVDHDDVNEEFFNTLNGSGLLKLQDTSLVSCDITSNEIVKMMSAKDNLKLIEVKEPESFKKWLPTFLKVFEFDREMTSDYLEKWGDLNTKENPDSFLNFKFIENDEVVAVGSLYITGNFAGMYNLAVPEKHRRKGYADSLTRQMAKYAYDRGVTHIGGAGSAMGMELYKNFDIKVHGTYSLWAYFHT